MKISEKNTYSTVHIMPTSKPQIVLKNLFHTLRTTRFGPLGFLWSDQFDRPKLFEILISKPGISASDLLRELYPNSKSISCKDIDSLADMVVAFTEGKNVFLSLESVLIERCASFQKRVLLAEYEIPRGKVSTYGRIANHLGKPGAARAVGTALATNPFPILIPCHRAIRSDGTLGGYQGGLQMKRALLEQEGLSFDLNGKVLFGQMHY